MTEPLTAEELAEWTPARRWECRQKFPRSWPKIKSFLDQMPVSMTKAHTIIAFCAAMQDVSVEVVRGPRRTEDAVVARMAAAYLIHRRCDNLSYSMIGKKLNRDHSTIIKAVRAVKADLDNSGDRFGEIVRYVEERLRGDI